jgi:hypothetical protein
MRVEPWQLLPVDIFPWPKSHPNINVSKTRHRFGLNHIDKSLLVTPPNLVEKEINLFVQNFSHGRLKTLRINPLTKRIYLRNCASELIRTDLKRQG